MLTLSWIGKDKVINHHQAVSVKGAALQYFNP